MLLSISSPVFLLLRSCICIDTSPTRENPFGIAFTPTSLIASRINSSGAIELTKHPLSSAYQAIYQDAIENFEPHAANLNDSSNALLFSEAIKTVTTILTRQLGKSPRYMSLFVPSIFRATMLNAAVEDILQESYLEQPFRQGWSREATCPGYGFLECRNLGRTREDCEDDGPVNLVLALEYEKGYLYAWMMQVGFYLETYFPVHSRFCRECGEGDWDAIGTQLHQQRLGDFLREFVVEALGECQRYGLATTRDSIRAIVLSGEAYSLGTTKLGEMARQVVGTGIVRVLTDIDPTEVVAHGAAVWASIVQQFPDRFIIETGSQVDESAYHDEL